MGLGSQLTVGEAVLQEPNGAVRGVGEVTEADEVRDVPASVPGFAGSDGCDDSFGAEVLQRVPEILDERLPCD